MADIKLYGITQDAFRYKILEQARTSFNQLAQQKNKEIEDTLKDFYRKRDDIFSYGWNLFLDGFGGAIGGLMNGIGDFLVSGEVMLKQFGQDLAYDVDKDGKETLNDWGYALTNIFIDAASGLQTWAAATAVDATKFIIKSSIEIDPNSYLAKMIPVLTSMSQTDNFIRQGNEDYKGNFNPLGDLMTFYGPGGGADTLKNWWDKQKADLRTGDFGKGFFQNTFTPEQIKNNQDIIFNSYSQSYYNDIKKIFEASETRRQYIDNLFQNKEITELIQRGGPGSEFAQFSRGVSQSIGRMLPSIAIAMLTGKITKGLNVEAVRTISAIVKFVSNLYFAGSVFGQSMEQAINSGANYDDAITFAYGNALSEMAIENLSGVIIGEEITVDSFRGLFKQALSEAGEEALAELGSVGFQKMYIPEKKEEITARSSKVRGEQPEYDGIVETPKEEKAMDYLSRVFISALSGAASGGILGIGNVLKAKYTASGRAESVQQILQQNIEEVGAERFAKESAPRIQKTLKDLQGTKLTQEQKDKIFLENPALSKVIARNVSKDDGKTISYELTKAGERLLKGDVSGFQGEKAITKEKYAISNELYLEELTESFDVKDEQGNTSKVKVNVLERQAIKDLDQETQQRVQETLKNFDNVVFVEMDENYNSYVDSKTGTVYINVKAADKADGFRALYAHEIHDYIRNLREQGKLEPQAAKAYDRFIKLLTNKKSVETLFANLPKEMVAVVRQVQENYSKEEQPREIASFFIQKILAAKEGGIKGLETLLAAKQGGFLNFFKIFANETILSRLIKQFGKSQELKTLLEGLDRAFGSAIAQSKEVLSRRQGIAFASEYFKNVMAIGGEDEETANVSSLAFSLAQKYPLLSAMVEDSQESIDFMKDEFVEKVANVFFPNITEKIKEDNVFTAEEIGNLINEIEKPKRTGNYGTNLTESILYFGKEKILNVLKKIKNRLEENAGGAGFYFETLVEEFKDEILDAVQIKVFDLDSKERKAGFIFSSRNIYFNKEDFSPFLKQNESRIYDFSFIFLHNVMEIRHIFRTKTKTNDIEDYRTNLWTRTTSIGGNIVDENLKIIKKNPLILSSVLNPSAINFLVDNNYLGAQSFSINNFGALDSTLGLFSGDTSPLDFSAKIILNTNVLNKEDTIVGKDDLYTPTRQFEYTSSPTYRLKYQQAGETNNLSENMNILSSMQVFKNTIDYVVQNRVLYGLPKDSKKITERNYGDVKLRALIPDDIELLQKSLDRITMSVSLAQQRQNAKALKKDINDANYFYNIPNIQEIVENVFNSIETLKTAILNDGIEPDEFVEILKELIKNGIYVLGQSNQTQVLEGRETLQKKYEAFKKEFDTIAYLYHFYTYQTTSIAEGKTQVYPQHIEVIHLTRYTAKKYQNKTYDKLFEWAKQNNIKVIETVDLNGAEDATLDYTRIPMRQTNDYLFEKSKNKPSIFLSKAGYKVEEGKDLSADYRASLDNLQENTSVEEALNLYALDNFLNAYGVNQENRTQEEKIALARGIKNTLAQVINKAIANLSQEEVVSPLAVFFAVDTFVQLELNKNIKPITDKIKEDVSTIGAFEKKVKQTFLNNQQVMMDAGISLNDYIYSRNREFLTRGEALRVLAHIYKAYAEAFVSKISTSTDYSMIQNVLPQEMENIKEFDNAFFSDDVSVRRSLGMFKYGELKQSILEAKYIFKDFSEEYKNKIFLTSPALKDIVGVKEGFLKNNTAIYDTLYEQGYDFGIGFKDHAFAFKTSDFNVGENEAIANIKFLNVSGVAPSFSFTVYTRVGDKLQFATNRMVYGAFVSKDGQIIQNPMIIEFGTSFENAKRILVQQKIYAQSASISPLASEVSSISRYARQHTIGNLGFIKVRFFLDPKSLEKTNNIVLPNDGWFPDKEHIGNSIYMAIASDQSQKEIDVSQRSGAVVAKTEEGVRAYDVKLATYALANIVLTQNFQDSSFAVDADDFATYINMNALEGFVKFIVSSGLSEAKSKQTISDIKLQIQRSLQPEYATTYFSMVENFYDTFVSIYNEFETTDIYKNRQVILAFSSLVQAYYEQKRGNYKPMALLLMASNPNFSLAMEMSKKFGNKLSTLANIIDVLPFRVRNTNEVRYNALDVENIKLMQVDMMARQENIDKMQQSDEMKDLLEKAKQKGIQVVLVNQSKAYEALASSKKEANKIISNEIIETPNTILESDKSYLTSIQNRMLDEQIVRQMESVGKITSTQYLIDNKLMFSKSQRIKDARQKKSREIMEEGKGRVIEQSVVPSTFQDTKEDIAKQEETRTKVSKVKFDTSLSRIQQKSGLYVVLVRNLKTIKTLIEFQKDKNFKKQYPSESAVISRGITELNKQKARLENILGIKVPVSPYDPNLEADASTREVEGIREALSEYRSDISTLYKDKKQTNTIMAKMESVLVQAIAKLDKEAENSNSAINEQGESAVKPSSVLEIEEVAKDLAKQPTYKRYLELLSGLKQINKLLNSSFASIDANIRQSLSKFKFALEKEISRLLNKAGIQIKDPLNTNLKIIDSVEGYFNKETMNVIEKRMYEMTSFDAKKNYSVYEERRSEFAKFFEKEGNELQGVSDLSIQTAQEQTQQTFDENSPTETIYTRDVKVGDVIWYDIGEQDELFENKIKIVKKPIRIIAIDDSKVTTQGKRPILVITYQVIGETGIRKNTFYTDPKNFKAHELQRFIPQKQETTTKKEVIDETIKQVKEETKQLAEEQKIMDEALVERKLVKGELAYVLRKLIDSRERMLLKELEEAKTPEEEGAIRKLLSEINILRRELKKDEVKVSDNFFSQNKDAIGKIKKDFENTKDLESFIKTYGGLLKVKEASLEANKKIAEARKVEKKEKEEYKQKYNGPVYVSIDQIRFSPGVQTPIGKIIFSPAKALSKGKTIVVKQAGQNVVYKPDTIKQQKQINGQVYLVEKARANFVRAEKILEKFNKANEEKLGKPKQNKEIVKKQERLNQAVESARKILAREETALAKIKRELDIVEKVLETPAITKTVGQKIYYKSGVDIEIPELKIKKYFFNLIKAFDFINGLIHDNVLKNKGRLMAENGKPEINPIATPTSASIKEIIPLEPFLNALATPSNDKQEAPVLPTQKPAKMWIPTENVTVVFGNQAYTLTLQEVQKRVANGDWNFSSKEQFVQYQTLVLQTMASQEEQKLQDAKTQQAIEQQTPVQTPIGNQNIALAKGVNFFKEAVAQAAINQPNQYEINESRWAKVIDVIEERLKNSKSKDDQRLYQVFLRLRQIIRGYRTDNRMYNHMSMAVAKVIIEEFDKFARLSSNNKVYIPSNADLKNVIEKVNSAVFAVLKYIDSELRVKINISEENPNGYLFWKAPYWYFRRMLEVKTWDKTQSDVFANDKHGNAYRRLINALHNFNVKGYGMLELVSAIEEFDLATAVQPVTDLAVDGKAARTVETTVQQMLSDAKTNEEISGTVNYNTMPIAPSLLDPYTIAEIVGQFDERSWAMTIMNKIIQAQERAYEVDRVFDEVFPEEWQKRKNEQLVGLERNTKQVVNLEGKSVPMSQIIYLRNMLFREIVRNRMIDLGIIKGEKTHHFDNGNKVDILAITEIKEKKQRNKVVATILDQNALLQELDTIVEGDNFAKEYNAKVYEFMSKSYPLINERFKEIQGANLVNDGETIAKAIPSMTQTQIQKIEEILPKGLKVQDTTGLYIPILLTSGSYFKAQKLNFKDILDMGVFDGMVSNLTDTNGIVSVESISNVLTTYQQEVRNYYGFHRVMRDMNLVLNTAIKDEDTGQKVFLNRYLPKWAIDYFERLVMDSAGYGQIDTGNEFVRKWLPAIRRNFYTSAIGANIKVIITQFASFLNLWNIYGQSDFGFLGKMIKNLASQAAPSQRIILEEMAKNNLHYWNRSKGGTFEIGEATKEGIKAKNIIQTLREFSMKGVTLTDNMINKAFYLTLLESVNPKTNQNYTPEEANKLLTIGIIRSQSTKAAIGKASILRSKNELVRIMVKFLGEPLKMLTQVYSSFKNVELIQKIKKNQNRISENVNAKIAVEEMKVQRAKEKLLALESVEGSQSFATETEEFQQTTRKEIEIAERELQEAKEKLEQVKEGAKRTIERVTKIIASEREVRRLGQGRITSLITVINFLSLLGFGFDMLRSGGGERDKERDEELWEYMMKKLGGRYIDEIVGMIPFARDIYGVIKGYDFATIGEFRSINTVGASISNIIRAIAEGDNINWNRTLYNLAIGVSEMLGVPAKSIERFFTTPLYYFNEPAFYQYNNFIGGPDRDNIELAQAIKDDDIQMISVIVDRKIAKRNIKIHVDVKNEIKSLIKSGFDISIVGIPDKVTEDGLERKLTSEEKVEFAEVYSKADAIVRKIIQSSQYRRLTGKYKARLIQAVYNYYYKYAKQDVLGIDTLSEDLTFTSLNQAYTYFIGRAEAYRNQQVKDSDRNIPTISLLN